MKRKHYKSPETRARQLAGLKGVRIQDHVPGVDIPKVEGMGLCASVPEETQKRVIELFCQGWTDRAIAKELNLSVFTTHNIRQHRLDEDSQFREKMFKLNFAQKMQAVAEGAADRVIELMPEMSAKDSVLALGIATDKLLALERNKSPDQLHQHVHLHATSDVRDAFMAAMKPKEVQ